MGNCLRHQSSPTSFSDYDDHYWDDFSAAKSFETSPSSSTKSKNSNNNIDCKTKSTTTATTEVKIRITKKQLAVLLGNKEMRLEQVLAQLLAQSHHHHGYDVNSLHRPWRPVLQSIPEVN